MKIGKKHLEPAQKWYVYLIKLKELASNCNFRFFVCLFSIFFISLISTWNKCVTSCIQSSIVWFVTLAIVPWCSNIYHKFYWVMKSVHNFIRKKRCSVMTVSCKNFQSKSNWIVSIQSIRSTTNHWFQLKKIRKCDSMIPNTKIGFHQQVSVVFYFLNFETNLLAQFWLIEYSFLSVNGTISVCVRLRKFVAWLKNWTTQNRIRKVPFIVYVTVNWLINSHINWRNWLSNYP